MGYNPAVVQYKAGCEGMMEEARNIKAAHKLGTKRNGLLIVCATLSPFLIIFLDSIFLERKSFFAENIGSHIGGSLTMAITAWFMYLMAPSLALISFLDIERKKKIYLFLACTLILFPLSWCALMFVGMGLYNVYP